MFGPCESSMAGMVRVSVEMKVWQYAGSSSCLWFVTGWVRMVWYGGSLHHGVWVDRCLGGQRWVC